MKIGIIGVGAFSTSIALFLANNKENKIIMWSENENLVKDFKKKKKLPTVDKTIPKNISLTNNINDAIDDIDILFMLTGIEYFENMCKEIKDRIFVTIPVVIGTKGIYNKSFTHNIAKKYLKNNIALISGPNFSMDLAKSEPIGFDLACKDKKTIAIIKKVFDFENVKIVPTKDMDGIAICGCIKNIYAIGSGIISGLGYGSSTLSLYLTSVYAELYEILYKLNSELETLLGLSGFGDLIMTCTSNNSRNYTYGTMVGNKSNKKDIKKYLENNTVEGFNSLEDIFTLCKKKHIKTPVINAIYSIIKEDSNSKELVKIITSK